MIIVSATGHRPPKLGGYHPVTSARLIRFAVQTIKQNPADQFLVGMALGWDQAVAEACVICMRPFVAVVPFEGQEKRWPANSQRNYNRLLSLATKVVVLNRTQVVDVNDAMHQRNKHLVDNCDAMHALWDGTFGGTHNCLNYARQKGVRVRNFWVDWLGFKSSTTQPLERTKE